MVRARRNRRSGTAAEPERRDLAQAIDGVGVSRGQIIVSRFLARETGTWRALPFGLNPASPPRQWSRRRLERLAHSGRAGSLEYLHGQTHRVGVLCGGDPALGAQYEV